jgi:hypothetical protein
VPVRKPDALPTAYVRDYYRNWWRMVTKRAPDKTLTGRCDGCGKKGVLGYALIHRGTPRTTNLLCDDCCEV